MSINLWHRATTAVRDRFRAGALAQYGAGLHTDCDDCAMPPADVEVPAPRQRGSAASASGTVGAKPARTG